MAAVVAAGIAFEKANTYCGTASMAGGHYFARSQWCLPTAEHYANLQRGLNAEAGGDNEYLRCEYEYLRREYEDLRREYEDLRREYEDLRREYEDLRPTFNNPGLVSSVWQGPPAGRVGHETPKPEWLLERIISTTNNRGDLVFDPFMGSGTTAVVADRLGCGWFGCDINREYVELALERIEADRLERSQLGLEL